MPTYEHRCEKCGDSFEEIRSMSAPQPTVCVKCGGELRQIFTPRNGAIYVQGDLPAYWSPLSGEMVTSRRQRREEMKRYGVVEVGNEPLRGRPCPRRT